MKFIMKVSIPTDVGNVKIKDGSLPKILKAILDDLKPDAVYFTEEYGSRAMLAVVDMTDASQMVKMAEPSFLAFEAGVEFHPAMTLDDLMKGASDMETAAHKYG